MRRTLCILTGIVLAAGSAAAVEFTFDTGAEGWTAAGEAHGIANFAASGGVLGLDYVTATTVFDPQVRSPEVSINAAREHWLVLDVAITAASGSAGQSFQIFYQNELGGFSEGRSRALNITPNMPMTRVVLDLAEVQPGRDPWQGTVTAFRIDPGRISDDLVGYRCEFDLIAITDDTDGDGIPDHAEIAYWGDLESADESTDHDANGVTDAKEIAFGLDPTVDEGEKLPAPGGWALLLLAAFVALAGASAIRVRHDVARSPNRATLRP